MHSHSTRIRPSLKTLCPSIPDELSAIIRKAGSLDPEDRYANFSSLLHDLNRVKDICQGILRGEQRGDFLVGHVDFQARFQIPPGLLDREKEYGMLDDAYHLVKTTGQSQVVCCWGPSGSGKSKLLEVWARAKERDTGGQHCLVGWAKVRMFPDGHRAYTDRRLIRWINTSSSPFRHSSRSFAHCLKPCSVTRVNRLYVGAVVSSTPSPSMETSFLPCCPRNGGSSCSMDKRVRRWIAT